MWRRLRAIIRSFTRAKGFAAAAVLAVALGVGVNAVVFSLFDRVLFRPLPYGEPERLVQVYSHLSVTGAGEPRMPLAITLGLARETDLFSGVGWATGGDPVPLVPVAGENPLFWLTGATTGALEVLGVRPVVGPGFAAMRATDLERPVLLTYETWQRRYGGSDDVLSLEWIARDARQRDVHWRVVGVLPEGFLLPSPKPVTAPFDGIYGIDPRLDQQFTRTDAVWVAPFARLAPGVSIATARSRVDAFVASRFPRWRSPSSLTSEQTTINVVSLQSGLATVARPYIWLAVAGAWAVLAATCLTLAMLLLTWNQSRRQDAGVRLALGASPRRLVVSALAESVFISAAGAIVAWLAYVWTRPLFASVLPQGLRSFAAETADVRVIVLTGCVALVSALAAGTVAAIRTSRLDPLDVLRPTQNSAAFKRVVEGAPLLAVQAALGVMLLVGALAILPGVLRALLAPPGFDARDLFVVDVPTANDETAWDAREQTRRGLAVLDVVRQLPGVRDAALSSHDPFWLSPTTRRWASNRSGFAGLVLPVDEAFFRAVGVPLKAGRALSRLDVEQQALVAIINESGVRALYPGVPVQSAIGRTVTTRDGPRVIVGVAADFSLGIDTPAQPTLFLPLSANEAYHSAGSAFPWNSYQTVIRMADARVPDVTLLSDRLREQPWIENSSLTTWVGARLERSVAAELDTAYETPRLLALIFGTLAGIALVLTIVAMYGLASFEIRRRREEMTVRLALGATPHALRRRLAVVIARPVTVGVLAGLPLSWVEVKLIGLSLPFVTAGAPEIYLTAATVIVVAALVAAWLPGRRLLTMRVAELLRST